MKTIVIGTFLGFLLGAAFLAACGSNGDGASPAASPSLSTPSAMKWTPFGPTVLVATGIDLGPGDLFTSSSIVENAGAARHRYLAVEVRANADGVAPVVIEVGILPALDETNFATEPQWIGSVEMRPLDNRRVTLTSALVPPARMKLALRLASPGSARVLGLSVRPYEEQLQ
jgi:hypothetical protein